MFWQPLVFAFSTDWIFGFSRCSFLLCLSPLSSKFRKCRHPVRWYGMQKLEEVRRQAAETRSFCWSLGSRCTMVSCKGRRRHWQRCEQTRYVAKRNCYSQSRGCVQFDPRSFILRSTVHCSQRPPRDETVNTNDDSTNRSNFAKQLTVRVAGVGESRSRMLLTCPGKPRTTSCRRLRQWYIAYCLFYCCMYLNCLCASLAYGLPELNKKNLLTNLLTYWYVGRSLKKLKT